jgi:branched-chain amino acid transport system ATP-binding protein
MPELGSGTRLPARQGERAAVDPLLQVRDVSRLFGSFRALDGVSLNVADGEILGLVGPNGSGKTTLINLISGLLAPSGGSIRFAGERVDGRPAFRLARMGINRTFQIPKPFHGLTVAENLRVAARGRAALGPEEILETVGLAGRERRVASELTASEQKRLDLARALAAGARLLLVDELGAGLSSSELEELAALLRSLVERLGLTLVVVEHLLGFLERISDRVVVLAAGAVIFDGALGDALADPQVIRTFIGE